MARGRPFDSITGKAAQVKATEARVKNARMRQTDSFREGVRQVLAAEVTDAAQLAAIRKSGMPVADRPTYRDFLIATSVMRAIQRGELGDILKLMQICGESVDAVAEETMAQDVVDEVQRAIAEVLTDGDD